MVIKLTEIKHKDKLLKATREKIQIIYKGTPIRLSADFSKETLQARGEWRDIFLSDEREEATTKNTQQDSPSDLIEKSKAFQIS